MPEREILNCDVLIVGAGPAGLACAIHLHDHIQQRGRIGPGYTTPRGGPGSRPADVAQPSIFVIEKGVHVGAHALSGAVMDPRALDELIPDWKQRGAPVTQMVTSEEILLLTNETLVQKLPLEKMPIVGEWMAEHLKKSNVQIPPPMVPPYLHNKGNYIVSIAELTKWLAEEAKKRGIEILEGVAGASLVTAGKTVLGVRCGDSGIGKDGKPKSTFQAGAEIRAKVTVLSEGVRGSLTKQLIAMEGLAADRHPQTYALGIKEIWELPAGTFPAGKVIHTLGFPLQKGPTEGWYLQEKDLGVMHTPVGLGYTASDSFGGSFVYGLDETRIAIGLVVGLDYKDPYLDPHHEFNRLKSHPFLHGMLSKGRLLAYGAKAIPEGGYYSMPRFYGDGYCLVGDSASFLNAARLKGVHLAMKSGMLAAEAITEALGKKDFSARQLGVYEDLFQQSWAKEELYAVRNWRAGYAKGLAQGAFHDLAQQFTKGKGLRDPLEVRADFEMTERFSVHHPDFQGLARKLPDGKITFDKETDVRASETAHAEDQPCHLIVPDLDLCKQRCTVEFGNPCQHFCPAGVYEWIQPTKSAEWGTPEKGSLRINAGNCVHCKTCDIKDPYENILWVVPEGGGGPRYKGM